MAVGGRGGVPVGRGARRLERGDRSAVDPPARLDDDGLAAPGVALQRAQVRGVLDAEGVRRLVLGLRVKEISLVMLDGVATHGFSKSSSRLQ